MRRFYFKSAVISTLLSSNVALAGGSEQNNFGDLFGLEYPLSSFIQRTPAIDDLISASDSIGSESPYLSPEQVTDKPASRKRSRHFDWKPLLHLLEQDLDIEIRASMSLIWLHLNEAQQAFFNNEPTGEKFFYSVRAQRRKLCKQTNIQSTKSKTGQSLSDEVSMRVSDFDWKPLLHLVEMTLDMEPYEAMKIIWSNMNKEQKSHFDKESHGKKFPWEFNIIRNLLHQKSSNPPVGNMTSLAPEILPQLSLQTPEMEAPLVEVMAGEESPKSLLHTGGTDFDWRPLHIFVESTLNLELYLAMNEIWSFMNVEQRNSFNNDKDKSSFRHALSRQRKMLRAKKKPPVHAPETLPQQMAPLIENVQLPGDILIPLPDDFVLLQVEPTTIQSDSGVANQEEPFVIDDAAMAQLNRLIDEFNAMGEAPREDTDFDWKTLQHLVEETLKKTPRYALEIIWLQMNKDQRDHFKNNVAERSFVSGLMEQRKILRQIKHTPPVEVIESHAPEMLPPMTEPLAESGQVSEDFVLPKPDSLVLPPVDPTSLITECEVVTYNEVMASLNPMPEKYDSREATPSEDSEPRLSLPASQVEVPQTKESEGKSENVESLSSRSSSVSHWEPSQNLVEMDEELVSMEISTVMDSYSVVVNPVVSLVIPDKARATPSPIIAEFISMGQAPREDATLPKLTLQASQMKPPLNVEASVRRDSGESSPIPRLNYFKWKPYKHLAETTLDMKIEEATEIIWSNLTQVDQNYFNNKPAKRAFYYSLYKYRKRLKNKQGNPPVENPGSLN